jgi:hypothetical protein
MSTDQVKQLRFMALVEETCQGAGGKQFLSREEYLEIVNRCYREIYGDNHDAGDALVHTR